MPDRRIVVRPRAADDIEEIFATIAADQPRAAERFESSVRRECELLADLPLGWRATRDGLGAPWRRSRSET